MVTWSLIRLKSLICQRKNGDVIWDLKIRKKGFDGMCRNGELEFDSTIMFDTSEKEG